MAPVSPADGSDAGRVPRCSQPVVDCSTDHATLHRRFACAMMAGNKQNQPIAARDCLVETRIDRAPRAIEIHAVKVEHPVRLDRALAQPPVPASIERCARSKWTRPGRRMRPLGRQLSDRLPRLGRWFGPVSCLRMASFAREWPDRGSHPTPQLGFIRAERAHWVEQAHGRRRPWAPESRLRHWPTYRPRSPPPGRPRPRMYRGDWVP